MLAVRDKTARKRFKRKEDDDKSSEGPSPPQGEPASYITHANDKAANASQSLAFAEVNGEQLFTRSDISVNVLTHGCGSGVTARGNGGDNHFHVNGAGSYLVNGTSLHNASTLSTSPESQFTFNVPPPSTSSYAATLPAPALPHLLVAPQDVTSGGVKANVFSPHSEASSSNHPATAHDLSPADPRNGLQPHHRLSPNSNRLPRPSERFYTSLKSPELDIEDVTDWSTVTFFASLYLKYNHALSPIVHKPTFAHDLATRRDKSDRQFRSFLLGLSM